MRRLTTRFGAVLLLTTVVTTNARADGPDRAGVDVENRVGFGGWNFGGRFDFDLGKFFDDDFFDHIGRRRGEDFDLDGLMERLRGMLEDLMERLREKLHGHFIGFDFHGARHFPCLVLEFDADGDGKLSDEERMAAAEARKADLLAEFDADGNGELDEEERAAARAARREAREEQRAAREAALLEEFDADGDGELSLEERIAAARAEREARFAAADTDGDGELSEEEIEAARAARCESGEMTEEEGEADIVVEELAIGRGFLRGDFNDDLLVDIADPVATLFLLFRGGERPVCLDAADANDDGRIALDDVMASLTTLFLGGAPLPEPSSAPGVDFTADDLDCDGVAPSPSR